jgi:hypothetical protein
VAAHGELPEVQGRVTKQSQRSRQWFPRIAVVIAGVVVLGLALFASVWDTYEPRAEGYELSANAREITVAFCGGTAETLDARTLREDERSVVVGIRLRVHRDQFGHGTVHRINFPLMTELGSRVVRDQRGNAVSQSQQFLCPG